jgi:ceramide glucosyltransferase
VWSFSAFCAPIRLKHTDTVPPLLHHALTVTGIACLVVAALYSTLALTASVIWRLRTRWTPRTLGQRPPVSVLKPLCGIEPDLYVNLRSFCQQDYPVFQLIFGVRDSADPALAIVDQLISEFPTLCIEVVINPRLYGDNFKNSNLMNMLEVARHDLLVIADSDARVQPDYIDAVTAPLQQPKVGLVTCIYRGIPTPNVWSRLGAMYINEWFMPSVLLAWLFGHANYASGQTLCLRRDTLEAIGGLRPIANHLADDYRLGEMVRSLGLKIVLSSYEVQAQHHEPNLQSLITHQIRWMRTLQILRPGSFRFLFLTFSLPLALLGMFVVSSAGVAINEITAGALFGLTCAAQLALHFAHRRRSDGAWLTDVAFIPVRDLLLCWTWLRTFFVSRVVWRGRQFSVDSHGVMHRST